MEPSRAGGGRGDVRLWQPGEGGIVGVVVLFDAF